MFALIRLIMTHVHMASAVAIGWAILYSNSAPACSACFANVTGKQADALNWAILSLLFVISSLLVGFAIFFIYLRRRSRFHSNYHQGEAQ